MDDEAVRPVDRTLDRQAVKAHWDNSRIESMDDKIWLAAETKLIKDRIPAGSRVLEAGCGEGEATLAYSQIPGVHIVAADYSLTRLNMARVRLADIYAKGRVPVPIGNVEFVLCDLSKVVPDGEFDVVVSQRFLVNLMSWEEQQVCILRLLSALRPGGTLLLMEGSLRGQRQLNAVRVALELEPIKEKWHNLFFEDAILDQFLAKVGCTIWETTGLGSFFLLTRGIRQFFDPMPSWDSRFNALAASPEMAEALQITKTYSRVRLWVCTKAKHASVKA